MRTRIVKIDAARPGQAFSRARDVLATGGVIAYPTDTFYGLGVDPKNAASVKKLFSIKDRLPDQPILLLLPDRDSVRDWAASLPPTAEDLMRQYWPGPLTLVFKARAEVVPELTAGTGTIGLRVPGSELTRQFLEFLGMALTGTSANLSGGPSPRTAEEAAAALGNRVDLILDGGPTTGGQPSTVVDVSEGRLRVVRAGAVKV